MKLEKERRHFVSLGNALTILGMFAAGASGYAALAADNATQKERVDNLKRETAEIKADGKDTKENVQKILNKLIEMEAARKANDRDARERDRAR